ncbi:MAG: ribonucleoside-diphosphate reductase subunit alpha [Aquisalimonadaceae bacterium]
MSASSARAQRPAPIPSQQPADRLQVIRRSGELTAFDADKIRIAMKKAFLATEGDNAAESARIHDSVEQLTHQVVAGLTRQPDATIIHIEDIQDQVELALMRTGEHKVARAYVLYREEHARRRQQEQPAAEPTAAGLSMTCADGSRAPLDEQALRTRLREACAGLADTDPERILTETRRNLYDGVTEAEVSRALVMCARSLIEREPAYGIATARLLLDQLRTEALSFVAGTTDAASAADMQDRYAPYFCACIRRGVELELLDERLLGFDLERLGEALQPERDLQFNYLGLQTLYDRYLQHWDDIRFELPQAFFMRVAMGLALNEVDREDKAVEFYRLLSSFDFMSSTPTLFNSGTRRPQLSSCYLTTVPDDLSGIYGAIRDNALLSKFAGGLGNDWTRVRALGARIKGTNGKSQGVVPFLKVANDTAVAVNQGGKRKGAVCAYLETWHLDVEEFLDLRKNTGDDRRRTHDMNTAHWVPDLFMQRVDADADWTLFSPDDAGHLHELYGRDFRTAYEELEERARRGELPNHRTVSAKQLWRRMLTMLFETGHPWITFKDPANLRSPQRHAGVVHCSNLCTEITLNTSDDEIAVCNLGSVNLAAHVGTDGLDRERLRNTVRTAVRMLDNVIDINWYSVPQARRSNLRHRPVGLGVMGFQDALYRLGLPYASEQAVDLADESMELVSFHAIDASADLARERGSYQSFQGSLWSQGILPVDSIPFVAEARDGDCTMDGSGRLDWSDVRDKVRGGMRNSNVMAIAPTATIANIVGVSQSIEPTYQNLYVKSNLSGEFTVVNPYLVDALRQRGLWDAVMVNDLKYFDGSVQSIERVPEDLKRLFATAFEFDPAWLIQAGARRQKWLDQSQSLNLYLAEPSGPKLDALYREAWRAGLKTTYYLRSMGATHVEKSTVTDGALNRVAACAIDDPGCEACQ